MGNEGRRDGRAKFGSKAGGSPLLALRESSGQASVEYAVVLVAFLAMLLALGAMWHAARDGRLLRLAVEAASHGTSEGISSGFLQDVALF